MKTMTSTTTLDKTAESKKGYWTDDEPRGLSVAIAPLGDNNVRISLSSEYWYRVQHFDLSEITIRQAWTKFNSVLKDCGRTLVIYSEPPYNGDEMKDTEEMVRPALMVRPAVHYEVPYLSAKQVDQIYYLLKHSLTTAKTEFSIAHGLCFDTSKGVPIPSKKRKRRRKKPLIVPWQTVEKNLK